MPDLVNPLVCATLQAKYPSAWGPGLWRGSQVIPVVIPVFSKLGSFNVVCLSWILANYPKGLGFGKGGL